MNIFNKGFPTRNDQKLIISNKSTSLNPNAAEFVPSSLRYSSSCAKNTDGTAIDTPVTPRKAVFNRSESTFSSNSDDEVHQYWRRQLPDDITPDFKVMGEEPPEASPISLVGLNILDDLEPSRSSGLAIATHLLNKGPEMSYSSNDDSILSERMRYSIPSYREDKSSASFNLPSNIWDKQLINGGSQFGDGREGYPVNSCSGDMNDLLNENILACDSEINPLEFLSAEFPGFAAESLAEVYCASGCDLNLSREMLLQLELQVDGGFNQNSTSKALSTLNPSALDFPVLRPTDNLQPATSPFQTVDKDNLLHFRTNSSGYSRGTTDFASAIRKIASQDSGQWKYEANCSTDMTAGTSKGLRAGNQRSFFYGDGLDTHLSSQKASVWLETGDAVGNMYSELREEARDHARVRNAYFEQAKQAYLIGNKALAKELSLKGQLHDVRMKAAHGKSKESVYRQRNPMLPDLQGRNEGQDTLIDLHGLHASEATQVLKQELSRLRNKARSIGHLQVLICVGTGHQTKGSRAPVRLPVAIEKFLLERGLDYTELQPGLLRVVLF